MAADRLSSSLLGVTAAFLLAGGLTGCADDGNPAFSEEGQAAFDRLGDARKEGIRAAVRRGELPPVALELIQPNGSINPELHRRAQLRPGRRPNARRWRVGSKLAWDLDQNGRIDQDEREITERDLYDAALGLR